MEAGLPEVTVTNYNDLVHLDQVIPYDRPSLITFLVLPGLAWVAHRM